MCFKVYDDSETIFRVVFLLFVKWRCITEETNASRRLVKLCGHESAMLIAMLQTRASEKSFFVSINFKERWGMLVAPARNRVSALACECNFGRKFGIAKEIFDGY